MGQRQCSLLQLESSGLPQVQHVSTPSQRPSLTYAVGQHLKYYSTSRRREIACTITKIEGESMELSCKPGILMPIAFLTSNWLIRPETDDVEIELDSETRPEQVAALTAYTGLVAGASPTDLTTALVAMGLEERRRVTQILKKMTEEDLKKQLEASKADNTRLTNENQQLRHQNGDAGRAEPERRPGEPHFRYKDLEKIPKELVEGPFEDFEIAKDVYATAYLIGRNASPEMYSFNPIKNPQIRVVWCYLIFIVLSQLCVIISITAIFPLAVETEATYVDCQNVTSIADLHARVFLLGIDSPEDCREAGNNKVAFTADAYGHRVDFYKIEKQTMFYDLVLKERSLQISILRLFCSAWVFSQVYFKRFKDVLALLDYHDFGFQFFIKIKGYTPANHWTICFPLIQYSVLLVVTCISYFIIWSLSEAFDIVLNALAFTFITEVGEYFNAPLAKEMGATKVDTPECEDDMNYLYPDYEIANFENEDGSYTDEGWYISKEEKKTGLLSDYIVRHNPKIYKHPTKRLQSILQILLVVLPILTVVLGGIRCHIQTVRLATGAIGGEL